ncbi:MAG: ATPase, AFG1 family [uncultured Acidimicrobiales bacterium]|uniref:ATPase, AFG1 family n=1 Tax=uncultured Acidimicrobiales bacterium TaxID=310071 RepID=A0A6J4J3F6_9ACTN|nr:MAG: ATPase, AFG1 family [uncultured Acidimicrobiales bacterium]
MAPERLVDRNPRLSAGELAARFSPPARFAEVRFETFVPNREHPSQAEALGELERFAASVVAPAPSTGGWGIFRRRAAPPAEASTRPGRYLDGGFGVGKTHLLASLWHAAPPPKAYVTFEALTAVIGFLGMAEAVRTFAGYRVLCIDEFELDDVANTLLTVTFLRAIIPEGVKVATTSNSIPERLGEGRFNAEDFRREIAAISEHFDALRIDGPDFRAASRPARTKALDEGAVQRLAGTSPNGVTLDAFPDLLAHLRRVHPVQFGALLDGAETVLLTGMHPIENQGSALLFVQLVDELYDAEVTFGATGCAVTEVFPESYRHGGFRKKYGRCESRLSAMLAEADRRA